MRLWTHPGDPEPVDLETLGMVEVTIDYEAAARAKYEFHVTRMVAVWEANDKIMILEGWTELPEGRREREIEAMRLVINAALNTNLVRPIV